MTENLKYRTRTTPVGDTHLPPPLGNLLLKARRLFVAMRYLLCPEPAETLGSLPFELVSSAEFHDTPRLESSRASRDLWLERTVRIVQSRSLSSVVQGRGMDNVKDVEGDENMSMDVSVHG